MPDIYLLGVDPWRNSDEYNDALKELRRSIRQLNAAEGRLSGTKNVRRRKARPKVISSVRAESSESG